MKANYGFTITDDDNPESILHMVLFEKKPTERDWNHILEELETDPEFTEVLNDYRWTMRYSTDDEVKLYKEQIEAYIDNNPDSGLATGLREI